MPSREGKIRRYSLSVVLLFSVLSMTLHEVGTEKWVLTIQEYSLTEFDCTSRQASHLKSYLQCHSRRKLSSNLHELDNSPEEQSKFFFGAVRSATVHLIGTRYAVIVDLKDESNDVFWVESLSQMHDTGRLGWTNTGTMKPLYSATIVSVSFMVD